MFPYHELEKLFKISCLFLVFVRIPNSDWQCIKIVNGLNKGLSKVPLLNCGALLLCPH